MRRSGSHIVECSRPSSTWISNASVFQIPRRQSMPRYRFAKTPDLRQVVTRAPVAAMDHDGHWMRTAPRRHAQLAELLRVRAIGHPFVSRRRGQTQNVVDGHRKILLTGHAVRCSYPRLGITDGTP